MEYKKIINNDDEWVGFVSREDYNQLKNSFWFRLKWKLSPSWLRIKWSLPPFNPIKIKVFQERRIK